MDKLFSSEPISRDHGIAIARIVLGFLLIYHGHEIFRSDVMAEYFKWQQFDDGPGKFLVYLGKGAEFVAGIMLVLGFATRIASVVTILTFAYITFILGGGKFWYEDQHPFMFLLLGILILFTGSGAWAIGKKE